VAKAAPTWAARQDKRVKEEKVDSFDKSWRAVEVKVNARTPKLAPERQTEGSAGYDLFADLKEPVALPVGGQARLIPTGVRLEIPQGFEGQVRARSGLASRGVMLANGVGTIDSDFRGEILVPLVAVAGGHIVHPGDRIAQLVFARLPETVLTAAESLSDTGRGSRGFGSTGA